MAVSFGSALEILGTTPRRVTTLTLLVKHPRQNGGARRREPFQLSKTNVHSIRIHHGLFSPSALDFLGLPARAQKKKPMLEFVPEPRRRGPLSSPPSGQRQTTSPAVPTPKSPGLLFHRPNMPCPRALFNQRRRLGTWASCSAPSGTGPPNGGNDFNGTSNSKSVRPSLHPSSIRTADLPPDSSEVLLKSSPPPAPWIPRRDDVSGTRCTTSDASSASNHSRPRCPLRLTDRHLTSCHSLNLSEFVCLCVAAPNHSRVSPDFSQEDSPALRGGDGPLLCCGGAPFLQTRVKSNLPTLPSAYAQGTPPLSEDTRPTIAAQRGLCRRRQAGARQIAPPLRSLQRLSAHSTTALNPGSNRRRLAQPWPAKHSGK